MATPAPESLPRHKNDALRLYAITDRRWLGTRALAEVVGQALDGGATMVQIREKDLPEPDFLIEAREIVALCHARGIPCIVNDNVQVALASGADGVHVGQEDMAAADVRRLIGPDAILGVSAQTVDEARAAEAAGADYLGVGAVFPTGSKDDAVDVAPDTLCDICAAVRIPVVAIGGITLQNVGVLAPSGIAGIAVISAIFAKPDIPAATAHLLAATTRMIERRALPADTSGALPAISGAIFDLDGTLLDSMGAWRTVASRYLAGLGITPDFDVDTPVTTMTLEEGAQWLNDLFHLNKSLDDILEGLSGTMADFYRDDAQLKPGARELLERLYARGLPLALATLTPRHLMAPAMERLDLNRYFLATFTSDEVGTSKHEPDIYFAAARALGTAADETLVFEDMPYALACARAAGFRVIGVFDKASAAAEQTLRQQAEHYVYTLAEIQDSWLEAQPH